MEDKVKLLIAQDDTTSSTLSEYFGMSKEFEVIGKTNSGNMVIDYIINKEPDLIIMDFILQDKDGISVLNYIKNNLSSAKKPKIVMFSHLSHEIFVLKALELGAVYFITKPCDLDELKDRIFELLCAKSNHSTPFTTDTKAKILDERISNVFISVGIPANVKGYQFLREGIKIVLDNPDIINNVTKQLYPSIAEVCDTTAVKVERSIRHAIGIAWNRGKIININKLFGIKIIDAYEKPTNSEFIALISDKLRRECR